MAETKDIETVTMVRSATGDLVQMSPEAAIEAMRTRAPGASRPAYKPAGPMPGFQRLNDGGVIAVDLDPDDAVRVAQRPASGPGFSLAFGSNDPRFREANAYKHDQNLWQRAVSRGGPRVALERAANVMSFGGYAALQDENPDDAEVRARANVSHPLSSAAGSVIGAVGTVLFPYGRFATVAGKGAMSAGKASAMVRAAHTAKAARTAGNYKSLATVGAKASDLVRAERSSLFAKNYLGGLASAAAPELGASVAIAAADFTDYNKPFSAQALVQDAGVLFLTGMALTAGIGAIGAGTKSVLAGGRKAVVGAGQKQAMKDASNFLRGAGRRMSYKGGSPVVGAAKNWVWQKAMTAAESKFTRRYITGELTERLMGSQAQLKKGLQKLHGLYTNADELVAAIDDVLTGLDGAHASILRRVQVDAQKVVGAREAVQITASHMKQYGEDFGRYFFRNIDDTKWAKTAIGDAEAALGKAFSDAVEAGNTKLAKQMSDHLKAVKAKGATADDALQHVFEARKQLFDTGSPAQVPTQETLHKAIRSMVNDDVQVMKELESFDAFAKAYGELDEIFRSIDTSDFSGGAMAGKRMADLTRTMSVYAEDLGFSKATLKRLADDADVMENLRMIEGLEGLSNLNAARKELLYNEKALRKALPVELREESIESLLSMQIEAISNFRLGTGKALKYLTYGGAPRGSMLFGGVLAYRAMTAAQKREAFHVSETILMGSASTPEQMMAAIEPTAGKLSSKDMELGTQYALTLATGTSYLMQQLPRSSDPTLTAADLSMTEIDSFFETQGALEAPNSVIASAIDGSVSVEAVEAIRTVLPELYKEMVLDIADFTQTADWDKLTENQKLGLDTFTGGALGVLQSWGPMPGPLFAQTPLQQQALGTNMQQSSPEMARLQAKVGSTGLQKVEAL